MKDGLALAQIMIMRDVRVDGNAYSVQGSILLRLTSD